MVDCLTSSLPPPLESVPLVRTLRHVPDVLQALQSLFQILAFEESQGKLKVRILQELDRIGSTFSQLQELTHIVDEPGYLVLVNILQVAFSH